MKKSLMIALPLLLCTAGACQRTALTAEATPLILTLHDGTKLALPAAEGWQTGQWPDALVNDWLGIILFTVGSAETNPPREVISRFAAAADQDNMTLTEVVEEAGGAVGVRFAYTEPGGGPSYEGKAVVRPLTPDGKLVIGLHGEWQPENRVQALADFDRFATGVSLVK